jgi:catechol 2,3-dioxygenase-like lactoylglutathione lyase family enzyme
MLVTVATGVRLNVSPCAPTLPVSRMQQSCVDEDDAWELEQSLGLGSREILVVRVVEEGDGCTARYTIRFRPGAPDAAVLRFDLAPDADPRLLDSSVPATVSLAGVFDHVGISVADLAASERFYRTVLSVVGVEPSHANAELVEWDDWAIGPTDREHPVTRGLHVGFRAPSREAVDAFWHAGIDAGYRDDGAPGRRKVYGPDYYGGFLLDPDGNSAEAVNTKREDPAPDGRVDHLWIRVRDPAASKRFYMTIAPHAGLRIGVDKPDHVQMVGENFSFSLIDDERPLTEHVHLAFPAQDDATVRAFHAAALAAGYEDHGGPGERAVYHPGYYGAFVLDPDGHNVEVVNHNR